MTSHVLIFYHAFEIWNLAFCCDVQLPVVMHVGLFSRSSMSLLQRPGRQSWGTFWGSRPFRFWAGGHENRRGSWGRSVGTSRKILFYLIMFKKYVRKWWLLKRNIIICPEVHVAVNGQILPGKLVIFVKLPEKLTFFGNLPVKIEMFLTRIHDPQISNQIDTAA